MNTPHLLPERVAEPHKVAALPKLSTIGTDLLETTSLRRFWVLFRPFLFVLLYILAAAIWNPWVAIPFLVGQFVANICAAHDVVHNALRLNAKRTNLLLFVYGILVMQSGHAFRISHLSHHALFPSKEDPEGAASFRSAWHSFLMGPTYVPSLWWWAFRRASRHPKEQTWMLSEAFVAVCTYVISFALITWTVAPLIYVAVMTFGSWLYPFVTVYFPHHHAGEEAVHQARTMHGKVFPWLLLGLNYHLEHHLYPRVPSANMRKLSERLLPYLKAEKAEVIQVP